MFNAGYKKEALAELERATKKYSSTYETTVEEISALHEKRLRSVNILKQVEAYINSIRNKPYEFDKTIREIRLRREKFEADLHNLELESKRVDQVSGRVVGAGVVTGAGVAALGPSAAMAVAMTFGTASTGTAIATLSGAAATNAALAWLGGGTLAAGAAGMAGGQALLALMGPLGWAIGGTAIVGGGMLANSKNKEIAHKAEASTRTVKKEIERMQEISAKVLALDSITKKMNSELGHLWEAMNAFPERDYRRFSNQDKDNLRRILNVAEALSKKIGEVVA